VKAGTKRKKREAEERESLSTRRKSREALLTSQVRRIDAELSDPYVQRHFKKKAKLQARLHAARTELDALWAEVDRESQVTGIPDKILP